MADTLDSMLEPGEQVIYRHVGRGPAGRALFVLQQHMVLLLLFGIYWSGNSLGFALLLFPVVALFYGFLFLFHRANFTAPWRESDALLTDRRLLYMPARPTPDVVEIAIAEMARVEPDYDRAILSVSTTNGTTYQLQRLSGYQGLTAAMAERAALPPPTLIGRLEGLSRRCISFGGIPFMVLAYKLFYALAPGYDRAHILDDLAWRIGWGSLLILLAMWFGSHLACLVGLTALRHRVSPAEVRAWLNMKSEDKWTARSSRWSLWKSQPYFLLAEWLWGEPMNGPNAEAAGHG